MKSKRTKGPRQAEEGRSRAAYPWGKYRAKRIQTEQWQPWSQMASGNKGQVRQALARKCRNTPL